jgi:hypothetical protein
VSKCFDAEKLPIAGGYYSAIKGISGFRKQAKDFATDTTVIRRYWMVGLT